MKTLLKLIEDVYNQDIGYEKIFYLLSNYDEIDKYCLHSIAEKTKNIETLQNILNHKNVYGLTRDYVNEKINNYKKASINLFKLATKFKKKYHIGKIPFENLINASDLELSKIDYSLKNYFLLQAYLQGSLPISDKKLEEILTNAVNLKFNNEYIVTKDYSNQNKYFIGLKNLENLDPITIKNCYINVDKKDGKLFKIELLKI